ncbi:MAG TPA: hypothetical protein VGL35_00550 [Rhizomicrobium sp.]|jgi:hypothetical protein
MPTTLTIDDDVLAAAKGLAARQRKSVGEVISSLPRSALRPAGAGGGTRGVPLLRKPKRMTPETPELVRQLHDELP